jgi:hypothetical protein
MFVLSFVFHMFSNDAIIYHNDEGMSFMTFVRRSLYLKRNNVSKDEGH